MDLELLEALALSDDRSAALAQLLPGSEDHDYYRALHAQHRRALDEADAVLAAWPDRHRHTPRYDRLRLRQLLHRVTTTPEAVADQVRDGAGEQILTATQLETAQWSINELRQRDRRGRVIAITRPAAPRPCSRTAHMSSAPNGVALRGPVRHPRDSPVARLHSSPSS
jgi:hypothetical protein